MTKNIFKNRTLFPLTIDCVVFGSQAKKNNVLLIQRKNEPFKGKWALPGGFVEEGESLEDCARRELEEETGVKDIYLKQFHTFSEPGRDPRGPIVTAAYYAVVRPENFVLNPTEDAEDARWFPLDKLPSLAFDHKIILQEGKKAMKKDLVCRSSVFHILPPTFTLTQLQNLMECFLEIELDKRNFRKKILTFSFIVETGKLLAGKKQRPAMLYSFNKKIFKKDYESDLRLSFI